MPTSVPFVCASDAQPLSRAGGVIKIPACRGTGGGSITYSAYKPSNNTHASTTVEVSTVSNFGSWPDDGISLIAYVRVVFSSDQGSGISLTLKPNAGTFDAKGLGSFIGLGAGRGASILTLLQNSALLTCGGVLPDGSGGGILNNIAQNLASPANMIDGAYETVIDGGCT